MDFSDDVIHNTLLVEAHLRQYYKADIRFGEWVCSINGNWAYKRAQNALALIVFAPQTGVQEVHGAIAEKWLESGGPDGPLGLPTTWEEGASPDERWGNFEYGRIVWSRQDGEAKILSNGPLPEMGDVVSSGLPWIRAPGEPDATVDLHKRGLFIRWANGMCLAIRSHPIFFKKSLLHYKEEEKHIWRYLRNHASRNHAKGRVKAVARQCRELDKALSDWREFDRNKAVREAGDWESRIRDLSDKKEALKSQSLERVRLGKARYATWLGGIPWRFFGKWKAEAVDSAAASWLSAESRRIDSEIAIAKEDKSQIEAVIRKHDAFDWISAYVRLGSAQAEHRRAVLKFLHWDTAMRQGANRIRPIAEELSAVDDSLESAHNELRTIRSEKEELKQLIFELSCCLDSYERKEVHGRCDAEFGDWNPDRCLERRLRREDALRRKIEELKRRRVKLFKVVLEMRDSVKDDDSAKCEKESVANGSYFVIDGNNIVWHSGRYGWRVLKTLLDWVKGKGIDYHLYFDASIVEFEAKLDEEKDTIGKAFIEEQIADENHTTKCPSRDEADKFILYHADKTGGHIISNDGYRPWESQYPWIGAKNNTEEVRRIHKFTVEGNVLSIPDLDIFEKIFISAS